MRPQQTASQTMSFIPNKDSHNANSEVVGLSRHRSGLQHPEGCTRRHGQPGRRRRVMHSCVQEFQRSSCPACETKNCVLLVGGPLPQMKNPCPDLGQRCSSGALQDLAVFSHAYIEPNSVTDQHTHVRPNAPLLSFTPHLMGLANSLQPRPSSGSVRHTVYLPSGAMRHRRYSQSHSGSLRSTVTSQSHAMSGSGRPIESAQFYSPSILSKRSGSSLALSISGSIKQTDQRQTHPTSASKKHSGPSHPKSGSVQYTESSQFRPASGSGKQRGSPQPPSVSWSVRPTESSPPPSACGSRNLRGSSQFHSVSGSRRLSEAHPSASRTRRHATAIHTHSIPAPTRPCKTFRPHLSPDPARPTKTSRPHFSPGPARPTETSQPHLSPGPTRPTKTSRPHLSPSPARPTKTSWPHLSPDPARPTKTSQILPHSGPTGQNETSQSCSSPGPIRRANTSHSHTSPLRHTEINGSHTSSGPIRCADTSQSQPSPGIAKPSKTNGLYTRPGPVRHSNTSYSHSKSKTTQRPVTNGSHPPIRHVHTSHYYTPSVLTVHPERYQYSPKLELRKHANTAHGHCNDDKLGQMSTYGSSSDPVLPIENSQTCSRFSIPSNGTLSQLDPPCHPKNHVEISQLPFGSVPANLAEQSPSPPGSHPIRQVKASPSPDGFTRLPAPSGSSLAWNSEPTQPPSQSVPDPMKCAEEGTHPTVCDPGKHPIICHSPSVPSGIAKSPFSSSGPIRHPFLFPSPIRSGSIGRTSAPPSSASTMRHIESAPSPTGSGPPPSGANTWRQLTPPPAPLSSAAGRPAEILPTLPASRGIGHFNAEAIPSSSRPVTSTETPLCAMLSSPVEHTNPARANTSHGSNLGSTTFPSTAVKCLQVSLCIPGSDTSISHCIPYLAGCSPAPCAERCSNASHSHFDLGPVAEIPASPSGPVTSHFGPPPYRCSNSSHSHSGLEPITPVGLSSGLGSAKCAGAWCSCSPLGKCSNSFHSHLPRDAWTSATTDAVALQSILHPVRCSNSAHSHSSPG
ncbi:uncharacterized protein [Narcine bancroftii]|uniref:uncharacterized protein n=1 Tax=Narcine bancroftii TaxID=1343680 RepID=UPI003832113C